MTTLRHLLFEKAIQHRALSFGAFTLKSGRVSPYFFNIARLCDGDSLALLGDLYAERLIKADIEFDMIFGPAYKAIPLVSATACALSDHHRNVPWCFNRKEIKGHGEGGVLVGAPLAGKVVIIDDIITAGTAIRESIDLIARNHAVPAAVVVMLDRQERGQDQRSAIQALQEHYRIPVIAIANLDDLIAYIEQTGDMKDSLSAMVKYREQYGV